MTARVAILQDYLGLDGRSRIVSSVVEVLNRRGIVPDIFTFSGAADAESFSSLGPGGSFRVVRLPRSPARLGHLLDQLALPRLARKHVRDYDFAITSDTAVHGFPVELPLLRLVCFPLERIAAYEERYRQPGYRAYWKIVRQLYAVAGRHTSYHGTWLAISNFTRDLMVASYPLTSERVEVVYAPAAFRDTNPSGMRTRSVLTLGRFHSDKRQLEQIALARRMPDTRFYIAGSTRGTRYLNRCVAAASDLENVRLMADAGWQELRDVLSSARVFLHSKRYEHLGLSAVEAIAHGCVPIVHDSGGQREVVTFDDLRYRTADEAEERLRDALDGRFDDKLPRLRAHAERFSERAFRLRIEPVVDRFLEQPRRPAPQRGG